MGIPAGAGGGELEPRYRHILCSLLHVYILRHIVYLDSGLRWEM